MTSDWKAPAVPLCRNEGCARPAEPGEDYCSACGLERSLFRRDDRREWTEDRTARGEAGR